MNTQYNISYKKSMGQNLMCIEPISTQSTLTEKTSPYKEDFRIKIVTNNNINGIAKTHIQYINSQPLFYYNISGFQSLAVILENKPLDYTLLSKLIYEIYDTLITCENYMLDIDKFIFTPELIFLSPDHSKIALCYYPLKDEDITISLGNLFDYLLKHINHSDERCVYITYSLHNHCQKDTFTPNTLMSYLSSDKKQITSSSSYENNTINAVYATNTSYEANNNSLITKRHKDTINNTATNNAYNTKDNYSQNAYKDNYNENNKNNYENYYEDDYKKFFDNKKKNKRFNNNNNTSSNMSNNSSNNSNNNLNYNSNNSFYNNLCNNSNNSFNNNADNNLYNIYDNDKKNLLKSFPPEVKIKAIALASVFILSILALLGMYIFKILDLPMLITLLFIPFVICGLGAYNIYKSIEGPLRNIIEKENINNETPYFYSNDIQDSGCTILLSTPENNDSHTLIYTGTDMNSKIELTHYPFTIGKSNDCDFTIQNPIISRLHGRISCNLNDNTTTYYVEDLNSTNGTFINNTPITPYQKYPITFGDNISFGHLTYIFR